MDLVDEFLKPGYVIACVIGFLAANLAFALFEIRATHRYWKEYKEAGQRMREKS